jgi:hypothetical protein
MDEKENQEILRRYIANDPSIEMHSAMAAFAQLRGRSVAPLVAGLTRLDGQGLRWLAEALPLVQPIEQPGGARLDAETEQALCDFLALRIRNREWKKVEEFILPIYLPLLQLLQQYGSGAAYMPVLSWAEEAAFVPALSWSKEPPRMPPPLRAAYDSCITVLAARDRYEQVGIPLVRASDTPQEDGAGNLLRPAGQHTGESEPARLMRPVE